MPRPALLQAQHLHIPAGGAGPGLLGPPASQGRLRLPPASVQDMNREVVKTDCASARIPELDFEVPAFSQKGVLTTIEGIIDRAVAGLEQDQPARRVRAGEGNSSGMESAWDVHPLPAGVTQGCWGQLWSVPRSPWSAALGCPQQLSPTLGCPHF